MKTAVITCSNAGLDYIEHRYNIPIFRSVIIFNDNEQYDDYTELKAKDFYERLENDKSAFPHTAFVSLGTVEKIFDELKAQGYERVLVILISDELSSLGRAITNFSESYEGLDIIVYNSCTLSYPEAKMALTAAKMFDEGASLDEVLKELDYIRDNNHLVFSVETLDFLIKNGRLSKFAGGIANLLSIRPLLHLNKKGKVETLEKIRTSKKARERMINLFLEETANKDVEAFIIHANASREVIDDVKNKVFEARSDIKEINEYPLTPVVGAHAGPGTISLGYIIKK